MSDKNTMNLLNRDLLKRFKNNGSELTEQANRFARLHPSPCERLEIFKTSCLLGSFSDVDLNCIRSFNMLYEICPVYAHFALMLYAGSIKYADDSNYKISFLRVDLFQSEEICRLFHDVSTFNGWANVLDSFYRKFPPDIVDSAVIMQLELHVQSRGFDMIGIVDIVKVLRWDPWFTWLYIAKLLEERFKSAEVACMWAPDHYTNMKEMIIGASLLLSLAE